MGKSAGTARSRAPIARPAACLSDRVQRSRAPRGGLESRSPPESGRGMTTDENTSQLPTDLPEGHPSTASQSRLPPHRRSHRRCQIPTVFSSFERNRRWLGSRAHKFSLMTASTRRGASRGLVAPSEAQAVIRLVVDVAAEGQRRERPIVSNSGSCVRRLRHEYSLSNALRAQTCQPWIPNSGERRL
jgi:hypothetical protein